MIWLRRGYALLAVLALLASTGCTTPLAVSKPSVAPASAPCPPMLERDLSTLEAARGGKP